MSATGNPTSTQWNIQQNNAAIAGSFRSGFLSTLSSNPTMTRTPNPPGSMGGARVVFGEIIRVGAGAYDCMLRVGGRFIGCSFGSTMVSHTFGHSFAALPVEGSYAIAVLFDYEATKGVVIAIVPYGMWGKDMEPKKMKAQRLDPYEPKHGYEQVSAYKTPIEDKEYEYKLNSSSNRPLDIIPGEFAILNEHRVGLRIGAFSSEIRGGGAFVRAERIDDEIRVGSISLTMWTALECFRSFNDLGYISGELKECNFQGERLGYKELKLSSDKDAGTECFPRVKEFKGYLGGQRNTFVLRPQTPDKPEEGVATTHVSESGKMLTRSASGISMELYDRIPIPKRIKEYWDPEGNKDDAKHEAKTPFDFGDNPHTVALQAYDSIAWNQKNDYLHLDGYDKDFEVPEEQDLKPLEDSDRDPENSREDFKKNKKRRAGLHIMPDGSVIIRDAWGSEIVLSGGNVYINTCGNVISMAHNDTVVMSGNSTVMKAKSGSVTATAAGGVVELLGGKHVTIVGGHDGGSEGGVLIEALGSGGGTESDKDKGLNSMVNGVVLKAAKSDVAMEGKNMKLLGESDIRVMTGKDGDSRSGRVIVSTEQVYTSTKSSASFLSDNTFFDVGKSGIQGVSRKGISLLSQSSVTVVQKSEKFAVPQWISVGEIAGVISSILETTKRSHDTIQEDVIMKPYDWKSFMEKILAVMGRSEDYGTTSGTEPYKPSKKFTFYQPSWQWMKKMYPELITVLPAPWNESLLKVNGSNPWPGEKAWEDGEFITLNENPNLENGYSKKRESLKDSCETKNNSIAAFVL